MDFWERTFRERQQEAKRFFGETEPPGVVTAFSWNDIRIPGACALRFPPIAYPQADEVRRDHWLHLTMGLSQPLDRAEVERDRAAGKRYSGRGFELGVVTDEECAWTADALYLLTTLITEGLQLKWGDRVGFGFQRREKEDGLTVFSGEPADLGIDAVGAIRAALVWQYRFPVHTLTTSTGGVMIFVAIGITHDEWQLAKSTTSAHLQLLLCKAGVGQRTDPMRRSVLERPEIAAEWERIASLDGEAAFAELKTLPG